MKTTLVVLAHPEPRSFNGAWADETRRACTALGDTVLWSDLGTSGFDAVERATHFGQLGTDLAFDPLKAQEAAAESECLPADVVEEIDKLKHADRVIFHFPLWWFAPPAVLKGWFDRVLAHGALHSVDQRFDNGMFRNKKALFCVTTGCSEAESAFNGKEADVRMLLWPSAYTLRYLGFTVLQPEIVHGVHGYHTGSKKDALQEHLSQVLARQAGLINAFDTRREIRFNRDDDFDVEGRLRPDRPSYSAFIRHAP